MGYVKKGNTMSVNLLRKDGWINLLAGLGKKSDKTKHNDWGGYILFDDATLSNMYDGDGLTSNIVDVVPNDMTRNGWEIKNDHDNLIAKEQTRLNASSHFNTALKYARLYRGSVIVIVTKYGTLDTALTEKSGPIIALRVYGADRMPIQSNNIVDNPKSKYFEEVELFPIYKRNGEEMKVHATRCLIFRGETCSDNGELGLNYRYWGFSTIQKIWSRLSNYSTTERGIANLMLEFSVGKYKLSNLAQMLAQGEDGIAACHNRIEIINASKSIINAVLLGENEEYTRETISVAGLADLVDRMQMNLSAVAKIPVSKLFGRSPAGMSATGEFDLRNYYDNASSAQETRMLFPLQYLTNYIGQYVYPGGITAQDGNPAEEYTIEFNSLWEPTEKEQAEINKLNAETDNLNIVNQIYGPEEARTMRYSELDEDSALLLPPLEEE